MKKKLKILLLSFLCLLVFPIYTKAWDEIGTGEGVDTGGGGNCTDASGCCFCRWNNKNFGSIKLTIVYYDGTTRHKLGNDIAYAKGYNDEWIRSRIKGVKIKNWLPYNNVLGRSDYSLQLKNTLLSQTQKSADYPLIREIFSDAGVDYNALLHAAKTRGAYTDKVTGKSFTNIINEKIGSKGQATKGIRIIVEPIFVYEETGFCPTFRKGLDRAMTAKNILAFAYGKTDTNGYRYMNNATLEAFSTAMYMPKGDAGFYPVNINNLRLSEVSNPNSGWGLNIYGPFDDISQVCDPDKEYPGYSSGVEYCCVTEKITTDDQRNNKTTAQGGNLTRPLTDYELRSTKKCNQKSELCRPDTDGVQTCCKKLGITPGTPVSVQQEYVNKKLLERVMSAQELLDAGCGDDGGGSSCKYLIDYAAPDTCQTGESKGKAIDIANWNCIFASSTSTKPGVKKHYFEDSSFSNNYCAVYCKQEINYALPAGDIEVYSGRFLLVGNVTSTFTSSTLGPVTYSGKKECRITSAKGNKSGTINVSKFKNDMSKVDDEIRTYWDEWKIWQAQQNACTTGSPQYYNGVRYTCDTSSKRPNYSTQIAAAKIKYEQALDKREKYVNQITACTDFASGVKYNEFNPKVTLSYEETVYGKDSSGKLKEWTLKQNDIVENVQTKYYQGGNASNGSSSTSTTTPVYENMPVYACSGNTPCTKTGTVKYPKTTWWQKNFDKNIEYTLPDDTYQWISKATGESFDEQEKAGGNNSVYMDLPNLPIHYSTMAGRYDFHLVTESFGDKNKMNDLIMKKGDKFQFGDGTYEGSKEYICQFTVKCDKHMITTDIDKYCEICGEEVDTCRKKLCKPDDPECLPCDPERDTCNGCSNPGGGTPGGGTPGGGTPGGGTPGGGTPGGGTPGGGTPGGGTPGGSCPTEECPSGKCPKRTNLDINLVFRSVSLYSPEQAFPGETGTGRRPGDNWFSLDGSLVTNYITKNRGVENYKVYKESPMYEVTLTPSLMKEIREYNKKQNGSVISIYNQTGIAGYADYNSMKCIGNASKCMSTVIRDWGVAGCGIRENFEHGKYPKCPTGADGQWGLTD